MNKSSLVVEVWERTGVDRADVAAVVGAVLDVVRETVARGERVTLSGFGSFEARRRAARLARNPRTGEPVRVPATVKPVFRPGRAFLEAVAPRRRRRAGRRTVAVRRRRRR